MSSDLLITSILSVIKQISGIHFSQNDLAFLEKVNNAVSDLDFHLQSLWILSALLVLFVVYDFKVATKHRQDPRPVRPLREFLQLLMWSLTLVFCALAFGVEAVIGAFLMSALASRRYPVFIISILLILSYFTLVFEKKRKYSFYFF